MNPIFYLNNKTCNFGRKEKKIFFENLKILHYDVGASVGIYC